MRLLGVSKCISCALMFVAVVAVAFGEMLPARLVVHMGFGGVVRDVRAPHPEGSPPVCIAPLKVSPATLYSSSSATGTAYCVSASPGGLDVQFLVPTQHPVDFDYPPTLSCVTLKPSEESDLLVKVTVTANDKRFPIECDIDRAFLYALSIERHGPAGLAFIHPTAGARAWHASIEIPWSVLALRSHDSQLQIALATGATTGRPLLVPLDVSVDDRDAYLGLAYSPAVHFTTPAPSSRRPGPRLHEIAADLMVAPDQHTMVDVAVAQNDAAVSVQRAYGEVINEAPLPLPSAAALNTGPDTIITRTQPLLSFLKPSTALGDQDLRVFLDSSPFTLNKVGSLASGYTAGYSSPKLSAGAFYGLQRPGLYDEAYALTLTIPTPEPRVTPVPTPSPIPSATPTPVKLGVAPPPLTTPGPIEESKTSHDPLATIAFLDSIAGNGTGFDNVSGVAVGTNFYRNACASETLYCAVTFHLFGSQQFDAYPLGATPGKPTPANATSMKTTGESASYTKILSAAGTNPSFVQIGEMLAAQQADRFFSPSAGSVTAFSPLSGPVGHVVFSYGTGANEHVYSVDLLATRLTSAYGDAFVDTASQVVVPFDTAGLRGWTFNAGVQSESVSDRVAELQQGLVTSYYTAIFPTPKSVGGPVSPGLVRPQTQQNATVTSPTFGNDLTVQVAGGFQNGQVTNCAPLPKSLIECATAHDHAATWAIFASHQPFGFGIANTASASIPGDLALASTSKYFGSYVNAPGSVTSYVSYTRCLSLSAGYTNAAYPTGIPLPQKGTTLSAKVYYPISTFGIEGGYFRTTDFQSSTYNQSGYYALLRFGTTFRKPVPSPGCPA
jgi:hypothetical protein